MVWTPYITISVVTRKDGMLLFVEELVVDQRVINQHASYLENNEGLATAVVRETMKETGWEFARCLARYLSLDTQGKQYYLSPLRFYWRFNQT